MHESSSEHLCWMSLIRLRRLRTLFSWCLTEALNQRGETFDGIVALGTKIDVLRVMASLSADQELSKLCYVNESYKRIR